MSSISNTLWFRTCVHLYEGTEPAFFEPERFEWARYIMQHWEMIRDELLNLISSDADLLLKPYFEGGLQSAKTNWKTEGFYFWTLANRPFIAKFPRTHSLLQNIPGLVSASVNLLELNSKINAHNGDTNAIYRCHLGLQVPAGLPHCGFRVKEEHRAWQEGGMLIFIDAFNHEAYNFSEGRRFILLLDVLRPEYRSRKHYICAKVLGLTKFEETINKVPNIKRKIEKYPFTKSVFVGIAQIYVAVYLFLQRNIFGTHLK